MSNDIELSSILIPKLLSISFNDIPIPPGMSTIKSKLLKYIFCRPGNSYPFFPSTIIKSLTAFGLISDKTAFKM